MEISTITDQAAFNGISDLNKKASTVAVQQQAQPEKAAAVQQSEQAPAEAISYNQAGISVDISEQGMEASKKNEMPAQTAPAATPTQPAYSNLQTTDFNKEYLEARQLVDENLPDMQIRERTQISETDLDRIRQELSQGV